MPRVIHLTNAPSPYREKVHELVSETLNGDYLVIYCTKLEPHRQWTFDYGNYQKLFLSEKSKRYIHNNLSVWKALNKLKPQIVIAAGFNPTMLYSFIWALLNGAKFITFTDGTLCSEMKLSFVHNLVRRMVFSKAKAYIGASNGSMQLYETYGIAKQKIFRSCLAVDNSSFTKINPKEYTLMFSGRLTDGKMPLFFVEVARLVKEKLGTCKVLILGSGYLNAQIEALLKSYDIAYEMPGFIQQEQLPDYYSRARLFLFPTVNDAWGIVANEAMAAGVPVITCKNAGVEGDLVLDNVNGFVLPCKPDKWADKVVELLSNDDLYAQFSQNAFKHVQQYNFPSAAAGIVDAVNFVHN